VVTELEWTDAAVNVMRDKI